MSWFTFNRLCCTNGLMAEGPLPRTDLSCGFRDGNAERCEAVQDGDTDLEFSHLKVEVPRHQALAQQFHTMHFGFDAASAVGTAPSSPERTAEVFRRPQGRVAGDCTWRLPAFHGLAFLCCGMMATAPRSAMASWHFLVS